jgi:cytochrome c551/c552
MPKNDTNDDPVVNSSLSVPLLISTLILMMTLVWALYDELYTMRPWKGYQQRFIAAYTGFLNNKVKQDQTALETKVKDSSAYKQLDQEFEQAQATAKEDFQSLSQQMGRGVLPRIDAVRTSFQVLKSEADALTYQMETSSSDSAKQSVQEKINQVKARVVNLALPSDDGSGNTEQVSMNYEQLDAEGARLRALRADLQGRQVAVTAPVTAAQQKRDAYLQENLFGLTATQVDGLIAKMDNFSIDIKQIHLADIDLVDRCESCHLGIREPVTISKTDLGEAVFATHPNPDLFKIHDPERFGCTSCHNGNGRATSSVEKAHGNYKFWLWPLYKPENYEAGCHQCHSREVVTEGAETLNAGRELFLNKGCWGCHRFEGFDKESEELTDVRQQMKINRDEQAGNDKERRRNIEMGDNASDNDQTQRYYARGEELRLRNAKLDAEYDAFQLEEKSLAREVKKFGPSLKEVRVKLRKEWIPVWLKNPHEFRPGTKMPVFRLEDDEIKAIAAFIWQSGIPGTLQQQPPGNAEHGKELFETRGCLGCHSMGEGDDKVGGDFAANLTRVGEKTNYNFLVRWVHNPRELTPDPTAPEGEIRPTPVMPNLRLSVEDARDVASYLITKKSDAQYAATDYMDDPELAKEGLTLVRHYGCFGCHEIKGLETESRIGTELTFEGSKPIERLDFALLTHEAENEDWYDHKGFFEHKLKNPAVFDQGKVKDHLEQLRMPNFELSDQQISSLTTFLLGAIETKFPVTYRFEPEDARADIQQGWWLVRRYNCNGCHQIRPGDVTALMNVPRYKDPAWVEQLPPQLYTEGARVQPDFLVRFLTNPALSDTDTNRNGVRRYLQAHMPTFYFSERQVGKLMRFFMARSSQPYPFMPEQIEPLTSEEQTLARVLFTGRAAPCLKCHMNGDPAHDRNATAPNFLIANERLKSDWAYRWLLDPAKIAPGTAMPSELFRQDGDRWVFNGNLPPMFDSYGGDHARLLVRYMFQITPDEVQRLRAASVQ